MRSDHGVAESLPSEEISSPLLRLPFGEHRSWRRELRLPAVDAPPAVDGEATFGAMEFVQLHRDGDPPCEEVR